MVSWFSNGFCSRVVLCSLAAFLVFSFPVPPAEADVPSEIAALAATLPNDPVKVFEYVRNNIKYVPYYGPLKGAVQTAYDQSGNDYDQALLLSALFSAKGWESSLVSGWMFSYVNSMMPDRGPNNWLGLTAAQTSPGAVTYILNKCIATGAAQLDQQNNPTGVWIYRIWVKVNYSSQWYHLDPINKRYTNSARMNVANMSGYNQSDLLNAARQGYTYDTNESSIKNVNQSNIATSMSSYAATLLSSLPTNSSVQDVVGRHEIIPTYASSLAAYNCVGQLGPDATLYSPYTTFTELKHTLRIQHQGINQLFEFPDVVGKRVTITYAAQNRAAQLKVEGTLVTTGSPCPSGERCLLTLTVEHPGQAAEQRTAYLTSGATYAIVVDPTGTSNKLIEKRNDILKGYIGQGLAGSSEEVTGESLHMLGLNYFKQRTLAEGALAQLADVIAVRYHGILIAGQDTGYFVDNRSERQAIASRNGTQGAADEAAYIRAAAGMMGALEHGVIEQLWQNQAALSTVKLLTLNNAGGKKLFLANNSNFASIRPKLLNYSTALLDQLGNQAAAGYTLLLPEDYQITQSGWNWTGVGYITRKDDGYGYVISGTWGSLNGGASANDGWISAFPLSNSVDANFLLYRGEKVVSQEPIDMFTGDYLYERTDLAYRKPEPLGMRFIRFYDSSKSSADNTRLGYGWTHNYDIRIEPASQAGALLGSGSANEAVPVITGLYVLLDLMKNQDNLEGWAVATLVDGWIADRMKDSAMNVRIGHKMLQFTKLQDGSFKSPPGITTTLVKNQDVYTLQERSGATITFNANKRAYQWKDIDNNTMTFAYDGDKLTSVTDCFNRVLLFSYNTANRIQSVTAKKTATGNDATDRTVYYAYDPSGSGDLWTYTDAESKPWNYRYDSSHRMTSLWDPLNNTTTNTYTNGKVTSQTNARGLTYAYYFSPYQPYGSYAYYSTETGPKNQNEAQNPVTYYYFDEKGRCIGQTNPLGYSTWRYYNDENNVIAVTNPRGYTTQYTYVTNNLMTVTPPGGYAATSYGYTTDSHYWLNSISAPTGSTSFVYGDGKHVTSMTTQAGATTYTYYAGGLVQTITDPNSRVTTFTYDTYGNPSSIQTAGDGQSRTITYSYNARDELESVSVSSGASYGFSYDKRGLMLGKTGSDVTNTVYVYDTAGNLSTKTDGSGTTTYTPTPMGKIQSIAYPDRTVSFSYDVRDNLRTMTDSTGTTTYTYDLANRLTGVTDPNGFIMGYGYDASGNVATLSYPGGVSATYAYDAVNLMTSVSGPASGATYHYDTAGRLSYTEFLNGTRTDYGYDAISRLTSLTNKKGSTVISSYTVTQLDGLGNRRQVTVEEPLLPDLPVATRSYTYNSSKTLLTSVGGETFSYDNMGNITGRTGGAFSASYAYGFGLTRLTSINSPSSQFTYDGAGNRLKAIRNNVTTYYVYDASGNLLAEADENKTIQKYYVYGNGLIATYILQPTPKAYTYHFNPIGSTIAVTDDQGAIKNKYAYSLFGELTQEETFSQPFKYVGQYGVMAEAMNLSYMRARYYDASLGRFLQQDPLGIGGGDINLYAYAGSNPVMFVDPEGLWFDCLPGSQPQYPIPSRSVILGGTSVVLSTASLFYPNPILKVATILVSSVTVFNAIVERNTTPSNVSKTQFGLTVGQELFSSGASLIPGPYGLGAAAIARGTGIVSFMYDLTKSISSPSIGNINPKP